MVSELALVPSGRTLRRWDAAAAMYTRVFVTLGAAAGWQIWSLAELHRSLLKAADALTLTARVVGLVGQVPVIGNGAGQLAGRITDTAAQLRRNAVTVRTQVQALAVVVAVADVEQGRHRPVAAAELKRLGLRPPAGWADTGGGSEPDRG